MCASNSTSTSATRGYIQIVPKRYLKSNFLDLIIFFSASCFISLHDILGGPCGWLPPQNLASISRVCVSLGFWASQKSKSTIWKSHRPVSMGPTVAHVRVVGLYTSEEARQTPRPEVPPAA